VLIVAHSNGALVAMRWLADAVRAPDGVYASVLSSPFCGFEIQVSAVKSLLGRVASRVMPSLSLPNELQVSHLTSDPERQRAREVDTLCHDVASARWFTEATATHRWVLDFAHRLTVPSLWLVAGGDRIADPAAARAVHDRIRSPSVFKELADLEHEVFNERDRASVFAEIGPFIEAHFPR
jgi:alpha-beta hydrolase superfamily lysophospholipase